MSVSAYDGRCAFRIRLSSTNPVSQYAPPTLLFITTSLLLATDKSEVVDVVNKHWKYQNTKDWGKYVGTMHSEGTMNGDSSGSFWYKGESTVAAVTEGQSPDNEFNFTPRYIEVDIL